VVLALAFGAAAEAKTAKSAEAVLAAGAMAEGRQVIDGRLWRCLGTGCRGRAVSAPKSQPILAECRAVASALGPAQPLPLRPRARGRRTRRLQRGGRSRAVGERRRPLNELGRGERAGDSG
jgi:hypothetical protein